MTGKIKVLLPLLLIFLLVGCGKTNDGLTIEGHDWTYANAIDSEGQPLDLPALTCSAQDGSLTVTDSDGSTQSGTYTLTQHDANDVLYDLTLDSETGKVSGYMTDFPSEAILGKPGIVCTPHLGASTPEAEDNCAIMAAQELSDYLRNGNITHSVNLPEVHQPRAGGKRICIIHKNEPGMISQITALTTEAGLNIENMVNKSKKNMAYTMLDATGAVDARLSEKLSNIPAVIRVRIL